MPLRSQLSLSVPTSTQPLSCAAGSEHAHHWINVQDPLRLARVPDCYVPGTQASLNFSHPCLSSSPSCHIPSFPWSHILGETTSLTNLASLERQCSPYSFTLGPRLSTGPQSLVSRRSSPPGQDRLSPVALSICPSFFRQQSIQQQCLWLPVAVKTEPTSSVQAHFPFRGLVRLDVHFSQLEAEQGSGQRSLSEAKDVPAEIISGYDAVPRNCSGSDHALKFYS